MNSTLPATSCTPAAKALYAAAAAHQACSDAGISDPAEILPIARYAEAAEQHQDALAGYRKIKNAHAAFAARHDVDDPGHDEHQRNLGTALETLRAAERLLNARRRELNEARGLGGFAGESAGRAIRS